MSKQIRIPMGDSRILKFEARDADTGGWMTAAELALWEISFQTEDLFKTSVANPSEVYTSTDAEIADSLYINILLLSTETDSIGRRCNRDQLVHFKLSLYKDDAPPVITTGAMGDLIFVDE